MIFYSKGNYGFISDKGMSIDNALGIDITTGDNINITTTDNDFSILAGQGRINIGDDSEEQLVRGNALVDLLSELLTELASETGVRSVGQNVKMHFGRRGDFTKLSHASDSFEGTAKSIFIILFMGADRMDTSVFSTECPTH